MPTLALIGWLLFGLLAVVVRVAIQLWRTGESGIRGISGTFGSIEWFAGVGFVAALGLGVAAPLLADGGDVEPIDAVDTTAVHVIGIVLYGVGLTALLVAQGSMGRSWRIGVDPSEQTALVTAGPFSVVRNPIYTTMLSTVLGLTLLVPSVVALGSMALLLASLELQTRIVEEPHLLSTHGEAYERYASRVGRFLPGIGRLG